MATRGNSGESFLVCDFCDFDSSVKSVVKRIGQKGICSDCISDFIKAINLDQLGRLVLEGAREIGKIKNQFQQLLYQLEG